MNRLIRRHKMLTNSFLLNRIHRVVKSYFLRRAGRYRSNNQYRKNYNSHKFEHNNVNLS
jgi:hypothetical protein